MKVSENKLLNYLAWNQKRRAAGRHNAAIPRKRNLLRLDGWCGVNYGDDNYSQKMKLVSLQYYKILKFLSLFLNPIQARLNNNKKRKIVQNSSKVVSSHHANLFSVFESRRFLHFQAATSQTFCLTRWSQVNSFRAVLIFAELQN